GPRDAVIEEPLQRLGGVRTGALERFEGGLGTLEEPEPATRDALPLVGLERVRPPAATVGATPLDVVLGQCSSVGEQADEHGGLEAAVDQQVAALPRQVGRLRAGLVAKGETHQRQIQATSAVELLALVMVRVVPDWLTVHPWAA